MRRPLTLALTLLPVVLGGCVERRIEITSEPPGALVWLNDQQIGRTPTEAEFLYHGVFDVRLEADGYEPLVTSSEASPPLFDRPPIDLFSELIPRRFENVHQWHFVLEPSLESTLSREELEAGLLERASAMRTGLEAIPPLVADDAEPELDETGTEEPGLDEAGSGDGRGR
jgi:hypothetical protein